MRYSYLDTKNNIQIILDVRRQKNIILHFKDNLLLVTSPKKISEAKLLEYSEKYKDRLIKPLDSHKYLHLWGKKYILEIFKGPNGIEIKDNTIYLSLKNPSPTNITKSLREFYNTELSKVYKAYIDEVRIKLSNNPLFKDKLSVLDNVSINYYKTFLGRCYINRKTIELSSYLAKYEPKYILGVIYHEMTHLLVAAHNQSFHKILDEIYPLNRIMTKEMKALAEDILKDFL